MTPELEKRLSEWVIKYGVRVDAMQELRELIADVEDSEYRRGVKEATEHRDGEWRLE